MQIMLSTSRGKRGGKGKKKSGRSLMLSEIMPFLSGDLGEQIQRAIEEENGERVQELMQKVGSKLRAKYESRKK